MPVHTPTTTHPIWAIEKRIWQSGITNLEQHIQTQQLPDPSRAANLRSHIAVEQGQSDDATFKNPHMTCSSDVIQLAYQADTQHNAAYCCSTYVKNGQGWKLVKHSRAPLAA